MKIDLCKIFGVEEGEEFRVNTRKLRYCVLNNTLMYWSETTRKFEISSGMYVNELTNIADIIKLPKKKEFTDDELAIMRSLPIEIKWIARDDDGAIFMYKDKAIKVNRSGKWSDIKAIYNSLHMFEHLFQTIQWEDEEPVFIDDYVERNN